MVLETVPVPSSGAVAPDRAEGAVRASRRPAAMFVAGSPPVHGWHSAVAGVNSGNATSWNAVNKSATTTATTATYGTSPFTPCAASPASDTVGRNSLAPVAAGSQGSGFLGRSVGFKVPPRKSSGKAGGQANGDGPTATLEAPSNVTSPSQPRATGPMEWSVTELTARLTSEGMASPTDAMPPRSPALFRHRTDGVLGVSPSGLHERGRLATMPVVLDEPPHSAATAPYSSVSVMSFSAGGTEVTRADHRQVVPFGAFSVDDAHLLELRSRHERLTDLLLATRGSWLHGRLRTGRAMATATAEEQRGRARSGGDEHECRVCGGQRVRRCFDCNGQGRFHRIEVQNRLVGGGVCEVCRGTGMIDCPACMKEEYRRARASAAWNNKPEPATDGAVAADVIRSAPCSLCSSEAQTDVQQTAPTDASLPVAGEVAPALGPHGAVPMTTATKVNVDVPGVHGLVPL
eukprot:ctg_1453.g382